MLRSPTASSVFVAITVLFELRLPWILLLTLEPILPRRELGPSFCLAWRPALWRPAMRSMSTFWMRMPRCSHASIASWSLAHR